MVLSEEVVIYHADSVNFFSADTGPSCLFHMFICSFSLVEGLFLTHLPVPKHLTQRLNIGYK